jgi:alkylation response protein AidB-like acyl-CoA dehydrogenase
MATTLNPPYTLSDELLQRCLERAPVYDRENRFFDDDFEELRASGYLTLPLPKELGGQGKTLAEVAAEQRRLAYHAAPTALAVNMHLYWVGLSADLLRAGDESCRWILEECARGAVFAAGHAESGNDVPLLYSSSRAERVSGGYRFFGRKSFGSLTPVWNYLGVHGMDTSDPANPRVVHGFMTREDEGYRIVPTWDNVLGMRATRSDDTILDGVFVPDERIARVVPTGFKGIDLFILGVFAWALMGFGNVYVGLARRVLDTTLEKLKSKKSVALVGESLTRHPGVQYELAEMWMDLEGAEMHLDRIAQDYSNGVNHGGLWGAKLVTAKHRAVEAAWRVADRALDVAGGFGIFPASGLERMVRDMRLGRIHPANSFLAREIVAKSILGLDLDAQPRWG